MDTLHRDAKSADADIRRTALMSLADLSRPLDAVGLLSEAASDENPDIRALAFERLSRLEGGMAAIEEKLGDANPEVRIAAIEALAANSKESGLTAALSLLHDADEQVRSKVHAMLSGLGYQL